MNYADIHEYDIANGPGIRLSLFVSGCTHACPGCFNQEAWDFNYGRPFTNQTMEKILNSMEESCYSGMTLLGGEPLEPVNQKSLLPLVRMFKKRFPDKNLWVYTGYLFEDDVLGKMLDAVDETREFLTYIDVLVDGPFILEKKDITLLYRGSSNQRIIDVQKSLKTGETVFWKSKNTSMRNYTGEK